MKFDVTIALAMLEGFGSIREKMQQRLGTGGQKMANEKHMYVIQADDGMFYCGMRYWDKQLRKAKIYHSLSFAKDVVDAYEACNCKILEITMSVVGEVQDGK